MGLTIHWSISLPDSFTPDQAVQRMTALHRLVTDLPGVVSPFVHIGAPTIRRVLARASRPELLWSVIQNERTVSIRRMPDGSARAAEPQTVNASGIGVPPQQLMGFTVDLGDGCESLSLFVAEFPTSVHVGRASTAHPAHISDEVSVPAPVRWTGHGFCKTQYASKPALGGITNFLRCHLSVIAALDAAAELGFHVEVLDESGYHEHRQVRMLVQTVGSWRSLVIDIGDHLRHRFGWTVAPAVTQTHLERSPVLTIDGALADRVLDLIDMTRGSVRDPDVVTPSG